MSYVKMIFEFKKIGGSKYQKVPRRISNARRIGRVGAYFLSSVDWVSIYGCLFPVFP
jgi:hypothetical protein